MRPRIIIADTDLQYILPLQLKFISDFFDQIDLEIITDEAYFETLFSTPQRVDILVLSENLYTESVHKHNIAHLFVMHEQQEEERTGQLNVNHIYKYTSTKEVFNEIVGKSADVLNIISKASKETQILLFYSAGGGVGKTTLAMGVSAALTKNYKRVLYINAARLQIFQHMLKNPSPITATDLYAKLASASEDIYSEMKYVLRKESFGYVPPFKASMLSLGLPYSLYEKLALSAKKSGDYDFIVVDADVTFDEEKANLLNIADKVILVTNQTFSSVMATNILVNNINGITPDKYIFICNNFDKNENNALISQDISLKFSISEYVDHFENYAQMTPEDLAKENSMQRVAFLII